MKEALKPFESPIYVTRPVLPDLDEVQQKLREIWDSRLLTNGGPNHVALERELGKYLSVPYVSLFCNGTVALQIALNALQLHGEVITTPFTFPATIHVLHWANITPVFCDISPETLTLDPECLEPLITDRTSALFPVHVFGLPCDVERMQEVADCHGLKVVYDAAHTFGVRYNGIPVASFGDASMFSFHATKIFHTFEGGAICTTDEALKARLDLMKNFGLQEERMAAESGINGKLNEFQAAIGLLVLKMVDEEIAKRERIYTAYYQRLKDIEGLSFLRIPPSVKTNFQYLPVLIDEQKFGCSRDVIHTRLRSFNVVPRKYFHPLCSRYPLYSALPSAQPENLPVAERISQQILCLPIYGDLGLDCVDKICELILSSR